MGIYLANALPLAVGLVGLFLLLLPVYLIKSDETLGFLELVELVKAINHLIQLFEHSLIGASALITDLRGVGLHNWILLPADLLRLLHHTADVLVLLLNDLALPPPHLDLMVDLPVALS